MSQPLTITLIVAVAENGVIGQGNTIPWRLKSDMQRFKALTMAKPIVMGRKTFLSLRRPLPGRTNIVVTRDAHFRAAGAIVTMSLKGALDVARGDALRRFATEIAIIGGADIYTQTLAIADRIELTQVHAMPDGDTYFAALDPAQWVEVDRTRHVASEIDSVDFSYVTYRRRVHD